MIIQIIIIIIIISRPILKKGVQGTFEGRDPLHLKTGKAHL